MLQAIKKSNGELFVLENKENPSWRDLLKSITSDPQEQRRIIDALGINAMTLRRWINGETNPRPQNLRLLLNVLPQHRKQLAPLLAAEFPTFKREMEALSEVEEAFIPVAFYMHLMNVYVSVAQHLRASTVSDLLLRQMVKQLDVDLNGLLIIIAQCVGPSSGQKVRSLRLTTGRGTDLWSNDVQHHARFFGVESLVGYAISSRHLTVLASGEEYRRAFPYDQIVGVESVMAAPIVMADQTAGCIYVASTQANYFTQPVVALLRNYIDLLCLAFEQNELFPLSEIELGIMPPLNKQHPLLRTFQQRVTRSMVQAASESKTVTLIQAERTIWCQLEDELLQLGAEAYQNQ